MVSRGETPHTPSMPHLSDLAGLWTRSLQAWPDGRRDTTTSVRWLQGVTAYADLRQPPAVTERTFQARCLNDLTMADCEVLATQQAFAGRFVAVGDSFEWVRVIDFQPERASRDIGRLHWQGGILVEEGLNGEYIEHWHRDAAAPVLPCGALTLTDRDDGRSGSLLRVGDMFMHTRGRQATAYGVDLAASVAGAASLDEARALLDFEISFGEIESDAWRIARSTLPFRVGAVLHRAAAGGGGRIRVSAQDASGGAVERCWEVATEEGDVSALLNGNPEKS